MKKDRISIIVPCYNEEENVVAFYEEIFQLKSSMECVFEIIFVDDGSNDKTLERIKMLHQKDRAVRYLSLSRNFGKEAAVFAGLEYSNADYTVIMDADLQDPPPLLQDMYQTLKMEDYECVATRRSNRHGEPKIRSFFAHLFYKIMGKITTIEVVDGARDYRMMNQKVVKAILSMGEYNRFLKGIYGWIGFKTKWIEYENIERNAGTTKWSFWKLVRYSIEGIVAFSTAPLVFAACLGMLFCAVSVIALCFIFIRALIWGDPVSGWPSLVCIISLLGGAQLLCLGILGIYLSKTYLETKKRPIYILKDSDYGQE